MAENYIPNPVATFVNDTTAVNTVNGNFTAISTALSDCLSLSGTPPNQMKNNLDMNSNQILNLAPPGSLNSPARLIDVVSNPSVTVPPTGTSGGVVGFLNGNNTYSGTSTFTNTVTLPANTVTRANLAQGAGFSVIGNTNSTTGNVADITGTTRQVLQVNAGGTALQFLQPKGDQLLGTALNDSAAAGNVGEYISSTIASGSAVALSTNTPANVTSISLTAGDWDVWINGYFSMTSTTTYSQIISSVSTTSATLNFNPGVFYESTISSNTPGFSCIQTAVVGPTRLSLASTTTVFLVSQAGFTASTVGAYGIIQARRVR